MRTLEIIPHVYQLTIKGVNIILIAEEELTLVDTGFRGSSSNIIGFIERLGRTAEEISLIILTHNHPDHTSGLTELKQFTRAKVAAHIADISIAESPPPNPPFSALRSLLSINLNEIDIHLEGGEVLKPLGGLKVIHTPGHTPGSISLFAPERRLLMVGDTINTRRKNLRLPPKMVSTSLNQTSSSITELARLDFDVLCAGHGRPLTTNARTRVLELIERMGIDNVHPK